MLGLRRGQAAGPQWAEGAKQQNRREGDRSWSSHSAARIVLLVSSSRQDGLRNMQAPDMGGHAGGKRIIVAPGALRHCYSCVNKL